MKCRYLLLMGCVGLMAAGGCLRPDRPGEYCDKVNGFGIIPPEGWQQKAGDEMALVYFYAPSDGPDDNFRENINVVAEERSSTKQEGPGSSTAAKSPGQDIPEYSVVSDRDIIINGNKANRQVCGFSYRGRAIMAISVSLVRGERAYVITCTAKPDTFARYEKTFDKCCESFIAD